MPGLSGRGVIADVQGGRTVGVRLHDQRVGPAMGGDLSSVVTG